MDAELERWVAAGLLSTEQAERIRAFEAERSRGLPSLVAEGLGYVGGVLVLVATATLAGRFWEDLGVTGRLTVAVLATGLLLAAGLAVPRPPVGAAGRMRAVSWLLSAAAFAGAAGLFADEVVGASGDVVVFSASLASAGYSAVLWWLHRAVAQHAAVVATLAATAGSAAALLPVQQEEIAGLAVWGVAVVWLLLGHGGVVARVPATVCGGVAAIVGSLLTIDNDWGGWLALGTAAAIVVAGVVVRDLVLLGVGAVATLFSVPWVVERWFPDTSLAPFVLLGVGAVLVAGALVVARRRGRVQVVDRRTLDRRVAFGVSAVVAVVVTIAVVVLGTA